MDEEKEMTRLMQFQNVQNDGFALFARKNHDYGDAFATFGPSGVIVRMQDKLMRYVNLQKDAETNEHSITLAPRIQQVEESLEDTLLDLHNYAAMAIMLLREKNPI